MQLLQVAPGALSPNPWNTNHITDPADEERLRHSLQELGTFKPILARELEDGSLQIIGGEHRWRAAQQLGHETVPVLNLGHVDDVRAKKMGLVDNARYGHDDPAGLADLLRELGAEMDLIMPLSDVDLAAISSSANEALDDLDSIGRTELPSLEDVKPPPTVQVLRFKVPVEDVGWVSTLIEKAKKQGGYTQEDSLSNAGNALVHMLRMVKDSL